MADKDDKDTIGRGTANKVNFNLQDKDAKATAASLEARAAEGKEAQKKADADPSANREPVKGASTAPVPAPQQATAGNVNATDLTRSNTTNLKGADDVRSQMVSDAAAEGSTDTAQQMLDPNAGVHQIGGTRLTAEDIELAEVILANKGGSREDVQDELTKRQMKRLTERNQREGNKEKGNLVYFKSSIPAFSIRAGRGVRLQFKNHFLATDDPGVQHYIRTQLMQVKNSQVKVEESSQSEYEKFNSPVIIQPTIEPLPVSEGLDGLRVQRAALFTKAVRDAKNPDPITPETGNGPRDQLSDRQLISTAEEVRSAVQEHNEDVVQQRRNAAEFNAAAGDRVAADALANDGTKATDAAATTGNTSSLDKTHPEGNPAKPGVTTGMQGSVGASSAPRAP